MCAMMKDSNCPMGLWGEAVCTAAYCVNRTPTSANGGVTLIQAFEGITPDISHMRIFYSDAYIHRSKLGGAKKLGDHARLVKFIGYLEGVSGYKFYDPNTCTVILSRSPHFLEPTHSDPNPTLSHSGVTSPNVLLDDDEISIASDTEHAPDPDPSPPSHPVSSPSPPLPQSLDEAPTRWLCDRSHIHAPQHLEPANFGAHG